jgi:hypothetical protein
MFIIVFTRALHWSLSWSSQYHPILSLRIHFNIIRLPKSWSCRWLLSFWLPQTTYIWILLSCYTLYPSHSPCLDHYNYTWWRVQIMKLFVIKFTSLSCHFIPLRFKYCVFTLFSNTVSICSSLSVRVQTPRDRPWRPIGLWDVKDPTLSRQSAHRLRLGREVAGLRPSEVN